METYGKQPEILEAVTETLMEDLADYSVELILKSFKAHALRNTKFPTSADLVGLIKRNGKPPLKESDIIHIRRKDGAERSQCEWSMLRDWERQQQEEWDSPLKQQLLAEENEYLKKKVTTLESENLKAWNVAKMVREVPARAFNTQSTREEKIKNTIEYLKSINAPQSDIDAFFEQLN